MVYFVRATVSGMVKIGWTADSDPTARLTALQTGSPEPLEVAGTVKGDRATEREFHQRFATARSHGEWFRPTPALMAYVNRLDPLRDKRNHGDGWKPFEERVTPRDHVLARQARNRYAEKRRRLEAIQLAALQAGITPEEWVRARAEAAAEELLHAQRFL